MEETSAVEAVDYDGVVASIELILGQTFQGASTANIIQAVELRICELDMLASHEIEYDEFSLEKEILEGLLSRMTSIGGVQATSPKVH